MHPKFATSAFALALAGFVLFLLVTLSPPHIRDIYLLQLRDESGSAAELRFGIYGVCYKLSSSAASGIRLPASECFELGLGYEIYYNPSGSTSITQPTSTHVLGRPALVSADLSRGLAMNPVTVAFAGISLICIGAAYFSAHERTTKSSVGVLVLTSIFAWVAFAIDMALAAVAVNKVKQVARVSGAIGNAPGMALGGAFALTVAAIFAGWGAFSRKAIHACNERLYQPHMREAHADAGDR